MPLILHYVLVCQLDSHSSSETVELALGDSPAGRIDESSSGLPVSDPHNDPPASCELAFFNSNFPTIAVKPDLLSTFGKIKRFEVWHADVTSELLSFAD
jgi:hypothetical protein